MELNCDRWIICQKDTAEPLRCPLRLAGTSDGAYSSFLSNVAQFCAIDALPAKLLFGDDQTLQAILHLILLLGTNLAI